MCCSVLQFVYTIDSAVCLAFLIVFCAPCSLLQSVAVCCSLLQSVAVYCSVVAVRCSMCCSMCCSVLQCGYTIHSAAYLAFEISNSCSAATVAVLQQLQCCNSCSAATVAVLQCTRNAVAVQLQCVAECLDESPGSVP